jgi:hypothetical protein
VDEARRLLELVADLDLPADQPVLPTRHLEAEERVDAVGHAEWELRCCHRPGR